jgi:drug/metabolite transporter (DMT)-like permease
MKRPDAVGYVIVILAALGFSFKSILAKLAYGYGVDAMTLLLMRVFIALPLILLTLLFLEGRAGLKVNAKELLVLAFMGIVGLGCAMLFSFYSLEVMDASLSVLVVFTYPALTVIMLAVFFGERAGPWKFISLGLTFLGLFLALRADRAGFMAINAHGLALALVAALSFALYNVLSERVLRESSPMRMVFYSTAFLAGFFGLLFHGGPYPAAPGAWGIAALLAIFSGFLPFILFLHGVKRIGAARTVIIASIGPVFTVLWAGIILGESLGVVQLWGMGLVILGIVLLKTEGMALPRWAMKGSAGPAMSAPPAGELATRGEGMDKGS